MADTHIIFFYRPHDLPQEGFGGRIRDVAATVAARADASTVVALVDDGNVGAPPQATYWPSQYDGALLVAGVAFADLPAGDAVYGVRRRIIKARPRGRDGARSAGFTIVSPVNRAAHVDHEQFNAHWRDVHSRVHVESSPGTRHYEQLIIDEWLTPGAMRWDGVGLLSFGSVEDVTERMFGPGGQEAISTDVKNFLASPMGETLPTSEFVYCDDGAI